MKKHTISFVIFVVGLVGLLVLSGFVFIPKNNTAEAGILDVGANGILGEPENTIDTLFVGDSLAYCAFMPLHIWEQTGSTSYVCATDLQQLQYTVEMVEHALSRQTPGVVFMEADAIYRDVSAATLLYSKIYNAFSVFRYHDRWKNLTVRDFTEKQSFTSRDDERGYRRFSDSKPAEVRDYMAPTDEVMPISDLNRELVGKIRDLCVEKGARFVLVSVPSMKNWSMARHNGIAALAESLEVDYLDLNMPGTVEIDWRADTRDRGDHMMYTGAVKVTDYILSYLEENNLLRDHRGDPAYNDWDEALQRVKNKPLT